MWRAFVYLLFTVFVSPTVLVAEIPSGHYDTADSSNANSLRRTLHNVIHNHTRHPYSSSKTDTWDILDSADEDPSNNTNILDVYRNMSLTKQGRGNDF